MPPNFEKSGPQQQKAKEISHRKLVPAPPRAQARPHQAKKRTSKIRLVGIEPTPYGTPCISRQELYPLNQRGRYENEPSTVTIRPAVIEISLCTDIHTYIHTHTHTHTHVPLHPLPGPAHRRQAEVRPPPPNSQRKGSRCDRCPCEDHAQLWRAQKQPTQAVCSRRRLHTPVRSPRLEHSSTKASLHSTGGVSPPTSLPACDRRPAACRLRGHICPCRHTTAGPSRGRASAALRPPPRGRKGRGTLGNAKQTERRGNRQKVTTGRCCWKKTPPQPSPHEALAEIFIEEKFTDEQSACSIVSPVVVAVSIDVLNKCTGPWCQRSKGILRKLQQMAKNTTRQEMQKKKKFSISSTHSWKENWVQSEHEGQEYGKFVLSHGKFWNDESLDKAAKPEDWDDEMDGEWEAPMIDNPEFKEGEKKMKEKQELEAKKDGENEDTSKSDDSMDDSDIGGDDLLNNNLPDTEVRLSFILFLVLMLIITRRPLYYWNLHFLRIFFFFYQSGHLTTIFPNSRKCFHTSGLKVTTSLPLHKAGRAIFECSKITKIAVSRSVRIRTRIRPNPNPPREDPPAADGQGGGRGDDDQRIPRADGAEPRQDNPLEQLIGNPLFQAMARAPAVNAVGNCRLPAFWRSDPDLWFLQVEAQFNIHQVTSDSTRFNMILTVLDPETISEVSDIIRAPPAQDSSTSYSAPSSLETRSHRSFYCRCVRSPAHERQTTSYAYAGLTCCPTQRDGCSRSSKNQTIDDELAAVADELHAVGPSVMATEVGRPRSRPASPGGAASSNSNSVGAQEIAELRAAIVQLTEITREALQRRDQPRGRSRSRTQPRSQSRPRSPTHRIEARPRGTAGTTRDTATWQSSAERLAPAAEEDSRAAGGQRDNDSDVRPTLPHAESRLASAIRVGFHHRQSRRRHHRSGSLEPLRTAYRPEEPPPLGQPDELVHIVPGRPAPQVHTISVAATGVPVGPCVDAYDAILAEFASDKARQARWPRSSTSRCNIESSRPDSPSLPALGASPAIDSQPRRPNSRSCSIGASSGLHRASGPVHCTSCRSLETPGGSRATTACSTPVLNRIDTLCLSSRTCFKRASARSFGRGSVQGVLPDPGRRRRHLEDGRHDTFRPLRVCSAQTFQRTMNYLLRDLDFVRCYQDDILVLSASHEQHLQHLRELLTILKRARLFVNWEKCQIGRSEVVFAGYLISERGFEPPAAKVEAIARFPKPSDSTQLRRFYRHAEFLPPMLASRCRAHVSPHGSSPRTAEEKRSLHGALKQTRHSSASSRLWLQRYDQLSTIQASLLLCTPTPRIRLLVPR
ncbi:unnamed protein product [Trichogramma brassicae]|uniref:Uncharacterized protein n=1 Tax=Trichogramma brassicae TaxID=86971 RepID=A0A6H5J137_9HYME|nr:unnamed protein product [Trichogramma brassicae]